MVSEHVKLIFLGDLFSFRGERGGGEGISVRYKTFLTYLKESLVSLRH